jgi:conjugative transfer signal peptidase TraF
LWNASASVPEGLYHVKPFDAPRPGELVVTRLPSTAAKLANDRHYLPFNVPLIKPVAAQPGQTVCRCGDEVAVNGVIVGRALGSDRLGRPLPAWAGCIRLRPNQIFVMNPAVSDSFDGRYFGPIERSLVIGRATPIFLVHPQTPTR